MGRYNSFLEDDRTVRESIAYVLSNCVRAAYNLTNPDQISPSQMLTAIDGQSVATQAQAGLNPPYVVYRLAPRTAVVAIAGITNLRQFLNYWLLSGQVANTYGAGLVCDSVQRSYTQMKTDLLARIRGGFASDVNIGVVICGHSAGGSIAQMLCQDLKNNHASNHSVKGTYVFGCPKIGNLACVSQSALQNVYSFQNQQDPIVNWPTDQIHSLFTNLAAGGAFNQGIIQLNRYEAARTCLNIRTGIGLVPPFRAFDNAHLLQILAFMAADRRLPDDHEIYNYVQGLKRANEGLLRAIPNPLVHDLTKDIQLLDNQFASTGSGGDWDTPPPVRPVATRPTAPVGGTSRIVPAIVRLRGNARQIGFTDSQRSARAANGDGRIKRQVKKMIQLMTSIDWHDGAVKSGLRRGTQYLHDATLFGEQESASWSLVRKLLEEVAVDK